MRKVTISTIQMDIKLGRLKDNVEKAFNLMERAAEGGSNLIVLPEMWPVGFDYESLGKLPPSYLDDILDLLTDVAGKYKLYIVAGSMCEPEGGKFFNTSYLIGPSGKPAGKYRKTHLFREIGEADFFTAGDAPVCFETSIGKIGIAICYDLRFPELFRAMALSGAEIICVPAQFPEPRLSHWQTLLRARAIENQLFVAASNRVGRTADTEYFGHSMIIGPYGEVLSEAGGNDSVITETVDIDKMYEIRKVLPALSDRRPEVYSNVLLENEAPRPSSKIFPEFREKDMGTFKFKDTIQPMKPRK